MTANSDLEYVTYQDAWEDVADMGSDNVQDWVDARLQDCIHPKNPPVYDGFYHEFYSNWIAPFWLN